MTRPTLLALLIASIVAAPGCTTLNLSRLWPAREVVEDARHPVTEVMCLWEAAEGTGLDGLPTRGFAGQILFFTSGQPSPAKVEGDVRVFLFDDEGVRGDKAQPIHQFDFPGAAWNTFITSTNFGTTYQMFIPYTKPGSHHAECEIRVRYTPEGGRPIFSRPCTVTLTGGPRGNGTARSKSNRRGSNGSMIQQASYEEAGDVPAIDPHTLQVPPSISSLAAASNGRARAIQTNRLNHLADSLAEERGDTIRVTGPAPEASREPALLPQPRRRLNPLAGETAALVPGPSEEPVDEAATADARARHILLSD
jgi:hypothetical protein